MLALITMVPFPLNFDDSLKPYFKKKNKKKSTSFTKVLNVNFDYMKVNFEEMVCEISS